MILKPIIQVVFTFMTRFRAEKLALAQLHVYEDLASGLTEEQARTPVTVPLMPGVDEDMTDWSMYMLLAHNAIVNRAITAVTEQLSKGEELHGAAVIDIKHDVLPGPDTGHEALEDFRTSVHDHIETVRGLGSLRGSPTFPHPVFGTFDAHKWNCMFAVHLKIHNRQARMIAGK